MANPYLINDVGSLRAVRRLPRAARIVVILPVLGEARSQELERRLNRLVGACGCQSSAAFFIVAVIGCAISDVLFWSAAREHLLTAVITNLGICFAAIALGRGLGLGYARWRLARVIRGVERQLSGFFG